jgi:hypothetical protein
MPPGAPSLLPPGPSPWRNGRRLTLICARIRDGATARRGSGLLVLAALANAP